MFNFTRMGVKPTVVGTSELSLEPLVGEELAHRDREIIGITSISLSEETMLKIEYEAREGSRKGGS